MQAFSLKELLAPWVDVVSEFDRVIGDLCLDTRLIHPGDLFIAVKGHEQDGCSFIETAVQKGAAAIICEKNAFFQSTRLLKSSENTFIPLYVIEGLNEKIGHIAARFYDYPSKKLTIIGVTGTNGKTSCTQWIAQSLTQLNQRCGIIGTLGSGFPGSLNLTTHTTPPAIELQKMLANFCIQQADTVAMEVSSHGLSEHRVTGIDFDLGVFTNLSHDHLDYHGTLENYAHAKKQLFDLPLRYRVLNLDDSYSAQWFAGYTSQKNCYGYTLQADAISHTPKQFLIYASDVSFSPDGIQATVHTPWGTSILKSSLLGRFNLSNLLAVLTSLCLLGFPLQQVLEALSTLETPPGRMQILGGKDRPKVVVDYAHTPDALAQALKSLRLHCNGKLWCVFGCGGNRDKTKRSEMGKIADEHADFVVITSDNPRYEDPELIIENISSGLSVNSGAVIEKNRHQAIIHAITSARPEDIVLIAGKGHERYQQIGDEKLPFSDVVEAQLALNNYEP